MAALVIVILVGGLAASVGDVVFARALRAWAPSAFAAAGFPGPSHLAYYAPLVMGHCFAFILRRDLRHHLQVGSSLRLFANVLHVLHVVLIGSALLAAALAFASSPILTGRAPT